MSANLPVSVIRFLQMLSVLGVSALALSGPSTAHPQRIDPTCPYPTTARGAHCVLTQDIALQGTLELAPNTTLNCQGHALTPIARGVLGDANTRSTPEAAIFFREGHGITVQGCLIDGFDFGILGINSKLTASAKDNPGNRAKVRNRITGNRVIVRFVGVNLIAVDNTEVANNEIRWLTKGGGGVLVQRDSDFIEVKNNTLTGDFPQGIQGARLVPGPTGVSNPVLFGNMNSAVLVTQVLGPHPTVLNAVVNNNLYQIATTTNAEVDETFTADTLVSGNVISYTGADITFEADDGIILLPSLRATVRNNAIGSARNGIRDGAIPSRQFPGKCTVDTTRLCLTQADCFISGIDLVSKGSCQLPPPQAVNWIARDGLTEGNRVTGPFNGGINVSGSNVIVRDNTVIGPQRTTTGIGGIRHLGGLVRRRWE